MSRGKWGETAVGPRHGGKPLGALQVGDLSLEQDDPVTLLGDPPLYRGDLAPLAPGEGLGEVDAQDEGDQDEEEKDVDGPEAQEAAIQEGHAATVQTGAGVRSAALRRAALPALPGEVCC